MSSSDLGQRIAVYRRRRGLSQTALASHVFRKTVATVLDEADLPLSALADQLGNTQTVADKHYRRRRVANEASAAALEDILPDSSRNERK